MQGNIIPLSWENTDNKTFLFNNTIIENTKELKNFSVLIGNKLKTT